MNSTYILLFGLTMFATMASQGATPPSLIYYSQSPQHLTAHLLELDQAGVEVVLGYLDATWAARRSDHSCDHVLGYNFFAAVYQAAKSIAGPCISDPKVELNHILSALNSPTLNRDKTPLPMAYAYKLEQERTLVLLNKWLKKYNQPLVKHSIERLKDTVLHRSKDLEPLLAVFDAAQAETRPYQSIRNLINDLSQAAQNQIGQKLILQGSAESTMALLNNWLMHHGQQPVKHTTDNLIYACLMYTKTEVQAILDAYENLEAANLRPAYEDIKKILRAIPVQEAKGTPFAQRDEKISIMNAWLEKNGQEQVVVGPRRPSSPLLPDNDTPSRQQQQTSLPMPVTPPVQPQIQPALAQNSVPTATPIPTPTDLVDKKTGLQKKKSSVMPLLTGLATGAALGLAAYAYLRQDKEEETDRPKEHEQTDEDQDDSKIKELLVERAQAEQPLWQPPRAT